MGNRQVIVAGGGAAGFFAAIACAESDPACAVALHEAGLNPLAKVLVSGGGRCNLTHACFEPRELVKRYPRGSRELLGAFHRWQPRDTEAWFASRGVPLKTESDGRMFPVTDDARTVADCLVDAAARSGVRLSTRSGVRTATPRPGGGFVVGLADGGSAECDCLLLATGGGQTNIGHEIARSLGHTIEPPVPSLFTFELDDPRLRELAGLAVEDAQASIPGTSLRERGPVLVTHRGLSGPAILRLSAWGARALNERGYRFALRLNWAPAFNRDTLVPELERLRTAHPRRQVSTGNPFGVPARLWERLVAAAGVRPAGLWAGVSGAVLRALAAQVCDGEYAVSDRNPFKEEFVTCGGVRLSEVDFKTMESRRVPGLHFAGEVLDIDGLTGGFNFQAAWTTGWLAGRAMAGRAE